MTTKQRQLRINEFKRKLEELQYACERKAWIITVKAFTRKEQDSMVLVKNKNVNKIKQQLVDLYEKEIKKWKN